MTHHGLEPIVVRTLETCYSLARETNMSSLNPSDERYEFLWSVRDMNDALYEFIGVIKTRATAVYAQVSQQQGLQGGALQCFLVPKALCCDVIVRW